MKSPLASQGRSRGLELRIPPLVVAGIIAVLMWAADASLPEGRFTTRLQSRFAAIIAVLGVIVSGLGFLRFKRAKTTVNPTRPQASSSLVTAGIYRRTRNPMYLGFVLMLLALAMWIGNLVSFALLPLFVLYMNRFQIGPEEQALTARFGKDFEVYRSTVRRWI